MTLGRLAFLSRRKTTSAKKVLPQPRRKPSVKTTVTQPSSQRSKPAPQASQETRQCTATGVEFVCPNAGLGRLSRDRNLSQKIALRLGQSFGQDGSPWWRRLQMWLRASFQLCTAPHPGGSVRAVFTTQRFIEERLPFPSLTRRVKTPGHRRSELTRPRDATHRDCSIEPPP